MHLVLPRRPDGCRPTRSLPGCRLQAAAHTRPSLLAPGGWLRLPTRDERGRLLCCGPDVFGSQWRWTATSACSVAVSYKPPMLVTRARLPACALLALLSLGSRSNACRPRLRRAVGMTGCSPEQAGQRRAASHEQGGGCLCTLRCHEGLTAAGRRARCPEPDCGQQHTPSRACLHQVGGSCCGQELGGVGCAAVPSEYDSSVELKCQQRM